MPGKQLSRSECRRLQIVKGDNWWINAAAAPNGIGPICSFCERLIDWGPRDHGTLCPVRTTLGFEDEE